MRTRCHYLGGHVPGGPQFDGPRAEDAGRRGFTLVELLVVMAIIAILASMTLGGISRARTAALRTACVNNLKQWGAAAQLYVHDNNDQLPREAAADGINSWQVTSSPSSQDVWYNALAEAAGVRAMTHYAQTPSSQQEFYTDGGVFHCPNAKFSDIGATYPNFSLAINSKLMEDFEAGPGSSVGQVRSRIIKMSQIRIPARTALFLDAGIPGEDPLCAYQAPYTGQPKAFAAEFAGRHSRRGNILFAAGHVETFRGEQVVDMDSESPNRGGAIHPGEILWRPNPAMPP